MRPVPISPNFERFACVVFVLAVLSFALQGCAGYGAIKAAETAEQRAYAMYGTFTVVQEQAAALMPLSSVPNEVKRQIQRIDRDAKPIADNVVDLAIAVTAARAEIEAGDTSDEQLAILTARLNGYVEQLAPLITRLATIIKEV